MLQIERKWKVLGFSCSVHKNLYDTGLEKNPKNCKFQTEFWNARFMLFTREIPDYLCCKVKNDEILGCCSPYFLCIDPIVGVFQI